MRKSVAVLISLLFFFGVAELSAQTIQLPDKPAPRHVVLTNGKMFWTGVSLLALSQMADGITTRQSLNRGNVEQNPLFGPRPSPARQAGVGLAFFGVGSTAFYFTERSRNPWIRWGGRAALGCTVVVYSHLAACNASLPTYPKFGKCSAF